MENKEEVLQALHEFENMTDADKVLTQELEHLLGYIAQTGRISYPWNSLKPVFMFKMDKVMRDFFESSPSRNSTSTEPTHLAEFEVMRQRLLDCLDAFSSPPFTVQRLCELMVEPKRHYKNSEKFMRGIEKNVLVVSTMLDEDQDEHVVNNIDAGHTVTSIPNGPVTNGIMTSAASTEMQPVNTSDTDRLSPHDYETHYPSQQEIENHIHSAQTNGDSHADEETKKTEGDTKGEETKGEDGGDDKQDTKTEESAQQSESILQPETPKEPNDNLSSKSETSDSQNNSSESREKDTEEEAEKPKEETASSTSPAEATSGPLQEEKDEEEPMDEN